MARRATPIPRVCRLGLCLLVLQFFRLSSQELPSAASALSEFNRDIAPILNAHCVSCHGPEKQKGQLRLDTPMGLLKGGDSGEPLFIQKKSAESYLVQRVTAENPEFFMPPKGPRLSAHEIATLRAWIDSGGIMPGTETSNAPTLTTDHWSFQGLQPVVPPPSDDPRALNPIDAFVFHKLKELGLRPSAKADKRALLRRLYLTMHGMPPSPEVVADFIGDERPNAYAHQVRAVLSSPRFGERWARHWLDVVRYADTNGFETNRERKTAFRYRDYVIDAFNHDKPYKQFILDQIAGDSSGNEIGTGFLVAGPHDIVKSPDINLTLMQRQDELADMINTSGTAFLGLTLGCARCHNHKFDPILQKDFYAIQAVFAGVSHGERRLKQVHDGTKADELRRLESESSQVEDELSQLRSIATSTPSSSSAKSLREAVNHQRNDEFFSPTRASFVRFTIHETSGGSEPCLDELEVYDSHGTNVALASGGTQASASGTLPGYPIHKLKHINDGRTGNNRSWISNNRDTAWIQLAFPEPQTIQRIVWGRDRSGTIKDRLPVRYTIEASHDARKWQPIASSEQRQPFQGSRDPLAFIARLDSKSADRATRLVARAARLETQIETSRSGPSAWVANLDTPPVTHRLYRGDPTQKREPVAPDALTVLGSLGMTMDEPEAKRRHKFASWIADKRNPLTARVLVNRLWHYTFGKGIVETPSDLGRNGIPPTHPALLDWLANEFIASDWSIKHIQGLILSSHTFQQTSHSDPLALQKDAGTRYLWRYPSRRLEAEAIRDSILSVSGALDLTHGGPGFYLHEVQVENVMHYFPKEQFGPETFRRMVYLFKIRQEQDAIFGAFDCPDGNQAISRRSRSNTPLQALNLFNSPFIIQQAAHLTERLEGEAPNDRKAQITSAFHLAFSRPPDRFELEASQEIIESEGLTAFCRALFNASEFLFVF